LPAATAALTGALGETAFKQYFLQQGCFVAAPVYDLWKTDFVIEWEGRLNKVNVKTMSKAPNAYHVQLQTGGAVRRRTYREGEIDYFGVVNLEYDKIWMIPLADVQGRTLISWIPPERRKNKLSKRAINWDQYRIK
tara:strand:- start:108 stop:515 length:408 start_codon:yes stop_codon:yes gene_type:complete